MLGLSVQQVPEVLEHIGPDHVTLIRRPVVTYGALAHVNAEVIPPEVAQDFQHLVVAVDGPQEDGVLELLAGDVSLPQQFPTPGLLLASHPPSERQLGRKDRIVLLNDLLVRHGERIELGQIGHERPRFRQAALQLLVEPFLDPHLFSLGDPLRCRSEAETAQDVMDLLVLAQGGPGIAVQYGRLVTRLPAKLNRALRRFPVVPLQAGVPFSFPGFLRRVFRFCGLGFVSTLLGRHRSGARPESR